MSDQPQKDSTSDAEEHWFNLFLRDSEKVVDVVGKVVADLGKAALDFLTEKGDSRPADAGDSSSASEGASRESGYADHSSSFDFGGGGGCSGV